MTTSTWYGVGDQAAQDRLVAAWPDAPVENLETLGFLLGTARDQIVSAMPDEEVPLPPDTGTMSYGPWRETRRNVVTVLSGSSGATLTPTGGAGREQSVTSAAGSTNSGVTLLPQALFTAGDWVSISVEVYSETPITVRLTTSQGGFAGVLIPARETTTVRAVLLATIPIRAWLIHTESPSSTFVVRNPLVEKAASNAPAFDGATPPPDPGTQYAWLGAAGTSASVCTKRDFVFTPDPVQLDGRYVLAQLQQTINLWNAGRVTQDGTLGDGGYVFTPRPLDKTIRGMIRPPIGRPRAF